MVAVVGGAGYVGSQAVLALREEGEHVVVVDDFSTGHRDALLGCDARVADIEDAASLARCLEELRPESVLHFAARIQVGEAEREPDLYWRTNVDGTRNVLDAARAAGVRNFVFSSSAAVYAPSADPLGEDAPIGPSGVYGRTKARAEELVAELCGEAGMSWAAMRYFNACGADPAGRLGEDHSPETHLLPLALAAAAGGPTLRVFGDDWPTPDGTCVRDYVHVADLAAGHVAALRHLRAGGAPGLFNLGTGVGTSVLEAVRAAERASGRAVPWELAPRRAGDPAALVASPALAQAVLGWSARYRSLDDAAAHQWAWMRAHPSGYAR